ncbi:MAG TPA: hypothetical protein PKX89_07585 [Chitinophagales bacterium]|nr:hypothetical protein [Chitinophagales bacterium]HNF19216.1 hypothetical protein [Chitinophagales bacterium]HNK12323.1 hypothetical protein [Chitinophagales bacterium]HNL57455.1 hypothetical protein [Chitinophagales bacterium]
MNRIILAYFLMICISNINANESNCRIKLNLSNTDTNTFFYISSETTFYYTSRMEGTIDSICYYVDAPIHTTLYINNDAEKAFQFYLHEGKYILNIDCKNNTATVVGSSLNDEYKEMMRINDSMFKKYNIMHAILYPYNGMDRDSAHLLLQKYLPLCNELSDKHVKLFYETHLSSFLTLEYIYSALKYTFEDLGYDTIEYDIKKLKTLFDRLDPKLKRYKMYDECIEMFNRERVNQTELPKPLFFYDEKINQPR